MNPGYYDGVVKSGWTEAADEGGTDLYACFAVDIPTPDDLDDTTEVIARHPLFGDYVDIGRKVCELVGLDWPGGLRDMAPCEGKRVRVKVKHKEQDGTVYENAYIVAPRSRKPATAEQVDAAIAKIEAGDKDLPF